MIKFRKIILFLFTFLSYITIGQNQFIDSLKLVTNKLKEDTNKVNNQLTICRSLWALGQIDSAHVYVDAAKKLANKINFQNGEAIAINLSGALFMFQGKYDIADPLFLKAIELSEKLNLKKLRANAFNNLGETNRLKGNYPISLQYHYKAIRLREEIKDSNGIAMSRNNIAVVNEKQGNLKAALNNYYLALNYYLQKNAKSDIARTYNNIAEVFRLQKQFRKALEYHALALKIRNSIEDKIGVCMSYLNIGSSQTDWAKTTSTKDNRLFCDSLYDCALSNFLKALEIQKDINDDFFLANIKLNIGVIYLFKKKYNLAETYINEAYLIAKKIGSKEVIKLCISYLTEYHFDTGNYKQACLYQKQYMQYKDSLINEESLKKTVESSMQYEFDKKEALAKAERIQKNILAEQEKQNQRLILYGVSFGLIIVIIFSFFLYNRFQVTNKQKKIIEAQEKETKFQKHLLEEKQKEIVDSINYAKRIQYALLASDNLLNQHLPDHFVLFQPKDVVSGDFYWAASTTEGFIYVTADCTGHGVPGAFMSLLNISKLSQAINENKIYKPNLILNNVRNEIIKVLNPEGTKEESKDGMDAIVCKLNTDKMQLEFAAANNSFYIIRNNAILHCQADKMPVGKGHDDSIEFSQNTLSLLKGDVIYTFTDGYADQFGGPKGKKFKYKQLENILLKIHNEPMPIQKEILLQTFLDWKGNLEQVDDVCIMGVRV